MSRKTSGRGLARKSEYDLRGVSIDTTSVCNIRCTICSLDDSYTPKRVMPMALFERLGPAFATLEHVAFSSSAEPLLHARLEEMIRFAKERSSGRIVTSLTTNATLLDQSRARTLIEAGLDALEVSLDGVSASTFERIRLGASFNQVMANVRSFVDTKRGMGSNSPSLSIRFTTHADNAQELPALLEVAARHEIRHVVVNNVEPYDASFASKVLYDRSPRPEMRDLYLKLEAQADARGLRLDLPRLSPEPFTSCGLTDHTCIIRVDGLVIPCSPLVYERSFHYFEEQHRHPQVSFGNIGEDDLLAIWNRPEYRRFRSDVREGRLPEFCTRCLKRAGVICPLRHWSWIDTHGSDPALRSRWQKALSLRSWVGLIKRTARRRSG